jgi:hypothetical protein
MPDGANSCSWDAVVTVTGVGAALPLVTARDPVTTTSLLVVFVDCAQPATGAAKAQALANNPNFQFARLMDVPPDLDRPNFNRPAAHFALLRN